MSLHARQRDSFMKTRVAFDSMQKFTAEIYDIVQYTTDTACMITRII
jgi:hypothetical protein